MTKIMSGFLALCLVAALGAGAQAKDKDKGHGAMKGTTMGMKGAHGCPAGQSWTKGYKNKKGKEVKGYCHR